MAKLRELFDHALEIRIAGAKFPGEPVSTAFRDLVTVCDHIELTGFAWPDDRINIEALLDVGHETRDLGFIVLSRWAINDLDLHSVLRSCLQYQRRFTVSAGSQPCARIRHQSIFRKYLLIRQGLPIDSSLREELAKRLFAIVCAQSRCGCFDLVIDFTVGTADLVEFELQRDRCFVIWNEHRPQVAAIAFSPGDPLQWLFSGSCDDFQN